MNLRKIIRNIISEASKKNTLKKILDSEQAYAILDSSAAAGTMWMQGGCAILAFALKKAYGYPVYVIYDKDLDQVDHFVNKTPNEEFIDYSGEQKYILKNFKNREKLQNKNLILKPYEPELNIADIVIDDTASNKLAYLIRQNKSLKEEYGGPGDFNLPSSHKAAMKVPIGGSSCASCIFLGEDKESCKNKFWIQWNGGESKLPFKADEYCSDWYQPKVKEEINESENNIWIQGGIILIKGEKLEDNTQKLFATHIEGLNQHNRVKVDNTPGKAANMVTLTGELYRLVIEDGKLKTYRVDWNNEKSLTKSLKFYGQRYHVVLNNNKTPMHWETLQYRYMPDVVNKLGYSILSIPEIKWSLK